MTDLELTRLCAEAMGIEICARHSHLWPHYFDGSINEWGEDVRYDPLHNDAQAMALVKKMDLRINRERHGTRYAVHTAQYQNMIMDADLNRAICECVANMQKAKTT